MICSRSFEEDDDRRWVTFVQATSFFWRRALWCPTWLGACCLLFFLDGPAIWWFIYGESFLSLTNRLPADVLVVEGWIGPTGVHAAAAEFRTGGYKYVVTTGSSPDDDRAWQDPGWNYAQLAANELGRLGIPTDEIIVAPARNTQRERTYDCAVAVLGKLRSLSISPRSINVFTWGPHARRSRLVFAKVEGADMEVGVFAWTPSCYQTLPWWRSSDRAKELLTETAGYLFEVLLN